MLIDGNSAFSSDMYYQTGSLALRAQCFARVDARQARLNTIHSSAQVEVSDMLKKVSKGPPYLHKNM